jgi:hypothetical protein
LLDIHLNLVGAALRHHFLAIWLVDCKKAKWALEIFEKLTKLTELKP